ncbi:MAG: tripartite tricarboxylate transporter substrate binding protein, partial [Burkholderiaceae bacterium]
IVRKLNAEVNRIMTSPDILARMEKLGADSSNNLDPQQFRQFVEAEVAKWGQTIRVTGVKVNQ